MSTVSNAEAKSLPQDVRKLITAAAMKKIKGTKRLQDLSQYHRHKHLPSLVTWNFSPGLTKISFAVWQKHPEWNRGYGCFYSYGGQGHSPKLSHCIEILLALELDIKKSIFSLDVSSLRSCEFEEEFKSIQAEFDYLSYRPVREIMPLKLKKQGFQETIEFIGQCTFCTKRAHSMIVALEKVERHMDKTTKIYVDDLSTGPASKHNSLYECAELAAMEFDRAE